MLHVCFIPFSTLDSHILLQNPSFETFTDCPDYSPHDFYIMGPWQRGSNNGNIFYHNYKCAEDSIQIDGGTNIPRPLPGGGTGFINIVQDGATTDKPEFRLYKQYIAQCLQTPLQKGVPYTFSFYAAFETQLANSSDNLPEVPFYVGVFGHADCSAIPFGNNYDSAGCPLNYKGWVQLGALQIGGLSHGWEKGTIPLTIPFDINVIVIGPDCSRSSTGGVNYIDDFTLLQTKDLNLQYITLASGSACTGNYVLQAPTQPAATYQWYKDSIAIKGATNPAYAVPQVAGNGYYNVSITTGNDCQTTEPLLVGVSQLLQYRFHDTDICNSETKTIAPRLASVFYKWGSSAKDTTVTVSEPGVYPIVASDIYGCSKSFTISVSKKVCANCEVFVPTAFSPNGDDINDVFKIQSFCIVEDYDLQIYNCWGAKIFETKDINYAWNGTVNGIEQPMDSYVFVIRYRTALSAPGFKQKNGLVTLIR